MALTVYQYPKCSTCRRALKWLEQRGVEHASVNIVEAPPSASTLGRAIEESGLSLRSFFNTSGESYRVGNFKQRLSSMSAAEAIAALAADGKLIKRPLVIGEGTVLVGFDEAAWARALG
jgi:arsenate reductase